MTTTGTSSAQSTLAAGDNFFLALKFDGTLGLGPQPQRPARQQFDHRQPRPGPGERPDGRDRHGGRRYLYGRQIRRHRLGLGLQRLRPARATTAPTTMPISSSVTQFAARLNNDIKNGVMTIGVLAGAIAIGITTLGVGDVAIGIGGVTFGTVGTIATGVSVGAGIGVAGVDCAHDVMTAQCALEASSARLGLIGGGLSLGGSILGDSASELAELGRPMQVMGDAGLGTGAVGMTIPTLFGDQLGLTNSLVCR